MITYPKVVIVVRCDMCSDEEVLEIPMNLVGNIDNLQVIRCINEKHNYFSNWVTDDEHIFCSDFCEEDFKELEIRNNKSKISRLTSTTQIKIGGVKK